MKRRALLAWLALALAACVRDPATPAIDAGALALRSFDGRTVSLADWRGKTVVLNVWATWCAPCRREMPSLDRLAARLDADRFAVIGVATDGDAFRVREWLRAAGIAFPNYLDHGAPNARELLAIRSYPQTFVIGADGAVRARFEGLRDWDAPEWPRRLERLAAP